MKRLLAIALCSALVAVSPLSAIAAEPGGSTSITAEDIKYIKDKLNYISGDVDELVNLVKAKDPNITINNNPTITNNPTNNNTNNPTTTNYNDNNVGGNTIGGNTITNNNNSSSDTTVTTTNTSSSEGGGVVPVPVPPVPPFPGGGGGNGGGGGSSSGSSSSSCVVYNGCSVYACRKIEINGCKSNATFMVNGVPGGTASSARDLAKKIGGSLVSCCETSAPGVVFKTAKVNFFVGGVTDDDNIAVYQLQNGKWVQLSVSEIRKDHVVVNMTKHGPIAFIRVPALAIIG